MPIDSLYSNLKVVIRPLDIKYSKATLIKTMKFVPIKLFNDYRTCIKFRG